MQVWERSPEKKKLTASLECEKMFGALVQPGVDASLSRKRPWVQIPYVPPSCLSMGEWLNPYLNEIVGLYFLRSDRQPQVRILLLKQLLWTNGVMVSTRGLYSRLARVAPD